jgi:hypothetical protein
LSATAIFSTLLHLFLQRIELGLLIGCQQSANLGLRCFVNVHHLRPLVRPRNRRVLAQRLRLVPRVCVDGLHLSHLVRRQIQLLGEKLNLTAWSAASMPWSSLVLRRWCRGILCSCRKRAQRCNSQRQNCCLQYSFTHHRYLHRILTLMSIIRRRVSLRWSSTATDALFSQRFFAL